MTKWLKSSNAEVEGTLASIANALMDKVTKGVFN